MVKRVKRVKRVLFILGLITLPLIGIGLDILRRLIVSWNSSNFPPYPAPLIYDTAAAVLFVFVLVWLAYQSRETSLPKVLAILLMVFGLYIVCIPLLRGTFLLPARVLSDITGSWQPYRTLSGAIWFVSGLFHLKA